MAVPQIKRLQIKQCNETFISNATASRDSIAIWNWTNKLTQQTVRGTDCYAAEVSFTTIRQAAAAAAADATFLINPPRGPNEAA